MLSEQQIENTMMLSDAADREQSDVVGHSK